MRQPTKQAYDLIKQFESCSLDTYLDEKDIPTIGWGHTGKEVKMGQTITQPYADDLLQADVQEAISTIEDFVDDIDRIPSLSYDSLVSFIYNVGRQAFRDPNNGSETRFSKTLNGDDPIMIGIRMKDWTKTDGKVCNGLVNRRRLESMLWMQGFE